MGALIITHYQRILHYVKPQFVHIMLDGRIVREGGVRARRPARARGLRLAARGGRSCLRPGPDRTKPGAARQATLYQPLAGAGAGANGRSPEELRAAALEAYESLELPSWRRSGFWTTSLRDLDFDALRAPPPRARRGSAGRRPTRCRARSSPACSCSAGPACVHVELDPELAEQGVILSSLEDAVRDHPELVGRVLHGAPDLRPRQAPGRRRGVLERRRLPATSPTASSSRSPSRSSTRSTSPAPRSTAHTLVGRRRRAATSACASTTSRPTSRVRRCTPARSSCTWRAARAAGSRTCRTGAARQRSSTSPPTSCASGRDGHCTGCPILPRRQAHPPAPRAGHGRAGGGHAPSAASTSPRATSTSTCSPSTCTRSAPRAATCTGRARRPAPARASFEGLIQIDPGAQQSHTYLQIHSMMLSPQARKVDAIPSRARLGRRRVGLARRHGGRARRGADLLHADARARRARRRARDRRGLLRAAHRPSSRTSRSRRSCASASRRSSPRAEDDIEAYAHAKSMMARPDGTAPRRPRRLPDLRAASSAGARSSTSTRPPPRRSREA